MNQMNSHGPIEESHRQTMHETGTILNDVFRGYGFALFVFELDAPGRFNRHKQGPPAQRQFHSRRYTRCYIASPLPPEPDVRHYAAAGTLPGGGGPSGSFNSRGQMVS